jgi:hypothetical protein
MYDKICEIECELVEYVHKHLDNLDDICTSELGEAVDMIKDLSMAKYYEMKVAEHHDKLEDIVEMNLEHMPHQERLDTKRKIEHILSTIEG